MDEIKVLSKIQVGNIFTFKIKNTKVLDLTSNNQELKKINPHSKEFTDYIFNKLNGRIGIGKYNENRTIYNQSGLFSTEARTVHLGIDLWVKKNTSILAILDSKIHSFHNNNHFGDYGPTIILEHEECGLKFYTLYGHLTEDSLNGIDKGQIIRKGKQFAKVGSEKVNGNWPPHLHFQIILDMQGKEGDFPGVASATDRQKYLKICPDSNLLLRI